MAQLFLILPINQQEKGENMGKNKIVAGIAVLAFVLLASSSAYAKGETVAGCGLGSLAFEEQDTKVRMIIMATTNGTFGSQTFGISSGTSNCELSGDRASNANVYIEANRIALANDIARGEGETLVSLSAILGVDNEEAFGSLLQKNYGEIFPTADVSSTEVSNAIIRISQS